METNFEKAKRQLKDHAAISGISLPDDGFIMKMLELAATPDVATIQLVKECDVCHRHPSMLITTSFGTFCTEHVRYI